MRKLLEHARVAEGLYYLSVVDNTFEEAYLGIRTKENRVYTNEELGQLPEKASRHVREWQLRQESADHLVKYLQANPKNTILEVGCGNGWLAHRVCNKTVSEVWALDLNEPELKQGAKVYHNKNLKFVYGDIFDSSFEVFKAKFDLIYLAASIQYFPELSLVLNRLKQFLSAQGEIHILDSPFYTNTTRAAAKQRSKTYYEELGFPEMVPYYHHHTWETIKALGGEVLYKSSRWQKLLGKRKSPFPWIKLTNK